MPFPTSIFWDPLHATYRESEGDVLSRLKDAFNFQAYPSAEISKLSQKWIQAIRSQKESKFSVNGFLNTYPLDTEQGKALLILAEAYLRIPDEKTRRAFIREKIASVSWDIQDDDASFVSKIASFGLNISRHFLSLKGGDGPLNALSNFTRYASEKVTEKAVLQSLKALGRLFILGETPEEAIKNAEKDKSYRHSFDMLGEAAISFEQAADYFESYKHMIDVASAADHHSISIKLSALYPRFEVLQRNDAIPALCEKLLELCLLASQKDIAITVDAEESERLLPSLEIFEKVFLHPSLKTYEGLGLAVQAYQKRALAVIDFLEDLGKRGRKSIRVRLVKGAYWDREIKVAQELGLKDFPVFTRKEHSDVSFLVCAQKLLSQSHLKPQFASHNAHTLAAILKMGEGKNFSLQRLYGMGEDLFALLQKGYPHIPYELYAPVGASKHLLSYLVRRLLENGGNSSFMHQIANKNILVEGLSEDPFAKAPHTGDTPHPKIALPADLFPDRKNSKGTDLSDYPTLTKLQKMVTTDIASLSPSMPQDLHLKELMERAEASQKHWESLSVQNRADCLLKLADLLEEDEHLFTLLCQEGRKTITDAVAEIREAVDFCRYYAQQAMKLMAKPTTLPGPVGETNELSYHARGVFLCISPWNFPLAIFLGQVTAALVCGNAVIAKPAAATPLIAHYAVSLAHKAGIPSDVLQLCLWPSSKMDAVIDHPLVAGVAFTGSTEVAHSIHRRLAQKEGPIVPFIAETGGLNAMIVDSSALFEQAITDIMTSAFRSAGQRCSALRILCVQEDIAEPFLKELQQAAQTLKMGDPADFGTDVGPLINASACTQIKNDLKILAKRADLLFELPSPKKLQDTIAPQAWRIGSIEEVDTEIFAPVLQVVTFKARDFEKTLKAINDLGYGLTCGLHTRLQERMDTARSILKVGNFYVNRSMIGAVVGVQPFGGEGMSGTGFKAGGPHYLLRFLSERSFSHNTTAAGGNASLVMLMA